MRWPMFVLSAALAFAALAPPSGLFADDAAAKPASVLDAFVEACRDDEKLADDKRTKVLELVEGLKKDGYGQDAILTEALRELHPDFGKALTALGEEELDRATAELEKLAGAGDPFLAAESTFFLARAHLMREDCEAALPLLEKVLGDMSGRTTHAAEALFLCGVAEAGLLDRKQAVETLGRFLKEHSDAPERMLVAAWRELHRLKQMEKGSLVDAQDHMEFSRRRLTLERSGEKTLEAQGEIIAMLDKLIEEAEKQGGS